MRIVDRQTFLALPPNTLYSKYAPCFMEHLHIKMDTLPSDYASDWWEVQIADAVDCQGSADFADKLHEAEKNGTSLAMDFETQGRDGCFDEDQLFAVWEDADVRALIERLSRCVKSDA